MVNPSVHLVAPAPARVREMAALEVPKPTILEPAILELGRLGIRPPGAVALELEVPGLRVVQGTLGLAI